MGPEDSASSAVGHGVCGVLPPTQHSRAPFLPGHKGWGGLLATGSQWPSVERRVWVGHERWLPGLPLLSQLWALPDASLTFTVTFSRGSGGTSDWQGPPPSACQHSVASAGSEHGAFNRQPSGCISCSRAARQRLRYARGSVGRG